MQHVYIHQSYKLLTENLISSVKEHCDDHLERRIILLVLFIILILAFYIVIWLPWISKITHDVIIFYLLKKTQNKFLDMEDKIKPRHDSFPYDLKDQKS